ncbi:hypothetical protein MHU86_22685 [Fragilaria crotonensis]|nr:hypothetical protein MHU86_22685 [Fragilaria crotonensis]
MAEIPLTEVFNVLTKTLLDNYHDVIRDSVLQQLQDTTWLSEDLIPLLTDSGFGMYHARDRNHIISLRKPALQRLINQRLKDRSSFGPRPCPCPDPFSYVCDRHSETTRILGCFR